jgi:hypothetical protein
VPRESQAKIRAILPCLPNRSNNLQAYLTFASVLGAATFASAELAGWAIPAKGGSGLRNGLVPDGRDEHHSHPREGPTADRGHGAPVGQLRGGRVRARRGLHEHGRRLHLAVEARHVGTLHHIGKGHRGKPVSEFEFRYNAREIDDKDRPVLIVSPRNGSASPTNSQLEETVLTAKQR